MGRKYDWFNGCYVGDRPQQEEQRDGQKKRKKSKQKRFIWTLELCKAEAKKYTTRSEWALRSQYSYITARANGWFEECCKHMLFKKADKYTLEKCREIAKGYSTRGEWQKKHPSSYHAARIKGWLDECCKHMVSGRIGIKPPNQKYSLEICKKEALKYNTRNEWRTNDQKMYLAVMHRGWLDECCKHMTAGFTRKEKEKPEKHQFNFFKERALLYKNLNDWRLNDENNYNMAAGNGWLNKINKLFLLRVLEEIKKEN